MHVYICKYIYIHTPSISQSRNSTTRPRASHVKRFFLPSVESPMSSSTIASRSSGFPFRTMLWPSWPSVSPLSLGCAIRWRRLQRWPSTSVSENKKNCSTSKCKWRLVARRERKGLNPTNSSLKSPQNQQVTCSASCSDLNPNHQLQNPHRQCENLSAGGDWSATSLWKQLVLPHPAHLPSLRRKMESKAGRLPSWLANEQSLHYSPVCQRGLELHTYCPLLVVANLN